MGITNQITGAVSMFLGNFQTAFNPQLVKSYATGDRKYFMELIFKSSKFSYFLMFLISFPIIVNCSFFLSIWLEEVPDYTVEFSQLMIVYLLLDAIASPLWISVQATGKIKKYQILMSIIILTNLPIAFIVLYLGYSPIYVFIGRVIINCITLLARIIYLRPLIKLPSRLFFHQVLLPIIIVSSLSIPIPLWIHSLIDIGWVNAILSSFSCLIISSSLIYYLGLTTGEKEVVRTYTLKKISSR